MEKDKRIELQKMVLFSVAGAGLIAAALVAPGVIGSIHKLRKMTKQNGYRYKNQINTTLVKLKKRGLLKAVERNGKYFYQLTEGGERELLKYRLKEKLVERRRWDGKWRIVSFDIRETRRTLRDTWRRNIRDFGFVELQKSVWVSPYECEELIQLLKAECRIGRDALYIVAERVENDRRLRDRFGLE